MLKVNRNLVQHQALAVLRWTAAVDCRLIRQLEHCRIMTCIADHVEIRVAECIREQLTLGIPAFEEQDYLAFSRIGITSSRSWQANRQPQQKAFLSAPIKLMNAKRPQPVITPAEVFSSVGIRLVRHAF